jgi:DDE superfamily endonuclease
VGVLAELSLEPEHRRGHGALYDAVNRGRVEVARLRRALAGLPLPAWPDGRIRLAADVSSWLRPARRPARSGCSAIAIRGAGGMRRWSRAGRTR